MYESIYVWPATLTHPCTDLFLSLRQIFRGDMTQVSLWSRVLAPEQVEALAACREVGRGDLFASDTFQLEVVGVKVTRLSLSSLCQ